MAKSGKSSGVIKRESSSGRFVVAKQAVKSDRFSSKEIKEAVQRVLAGAGGKKR